MSCWDNNRNDKSITVLHGEPDAWKHACPVRKEGLRNLLPRGSKALCPYFTRKLVAIKFDSSKFTRKSGRPRKPDELEQLVLKFAGENKVWGYPRITGALKNLGFDICPSTVANIMKSNGLNPSGDRMKGGMSWMEFIRSHRSVKVKISSDNPKKLR